MNQFQPTAFSVQLIKASRTTRFFNLVIDMLIMSVTVGLLLDLAKPLLPGLLTKKYILASGNNWEFAFGVPFVLIKWFIYYLLFEALMNGQTPGKMITKTRAVQLDGTPMETGMVVLRSLLRIIPLEAICIFFGEPWHDKWSKTMVVNDAARLH